MKGILAEILVDGDKAQAFHCYRDNHKERFTLTFNFADGTSHSIVNRHMISANIDLAGDITIYFVASIVKLTGDNLAPLLGAISRGCVAQIHERHIARSEFSEGAPLVHRIEIITI